MSVLFRTILAVAMLVATAGATAMAARAARKPAIPQRLVLRITDLPSGYKLTVARAVDNRQAAKLAHVSVAFLNQKGRVMSYETDFERIVPKGKKAPAGLLLLESQAATYRDRAGAIWNYNLS